MNPRKTKEIESALLAKGFRKANRDHSYFFLHVDGKKTSVWTKISHGMREYSGGLLRTVVRQLRLSKSQFNDLVDCPMSGDEYVDLLRENEDIRL